MVPPPQPRYRPISKTSPLLTASSSSRLSSTATMSNSTKHNSPMPKAPPRSSRCSRNRRPAAPITPTRDGRKPLRRAFRGYSSITCWHGRPRCFSGIPGFAAATLEEFRRPPRQWFFAKRWLWQIGYFLLIWLFNVFPLPQLSGFRESFRFAGETVDRGYSLLVFPEGVVNVRNSPDMIPFQPGIGLLARNLRIPVVPMRFDGLWQMKQEHRRFAHIGEITIHIGAPVRFPPDTPPSEIASRLEQLVASL